MTENKNDRPIGSGPVAAPEPTGLITSLTNLSPDPDGWASEIVQDVAEALAVEDVLCRIDQRRRHAADWPECVCHWNALIDDIALEDWALDGEA